MIVIPELALATISDKSISEQRSETCVSPMMYRFVVDSLESALLGHRHCRYFLWGEVTRGSPRVSHVCPVNDGGLVLRLTNVSDRLGAYWSETEARFMSANDSRHVIYSGLSGTRAYWLSIYAALPAPCGTLIIYWVKVKFSFPPPEGTFGFLVAFCSAVLPQHFDTWQMHRIENFYRKRIN
jgi:hypothetical protein